MLSYIALVVLIVSYVYLQIDIHKLSQTRATVTSCRFVESGTMLNTVAALSAVQDDIRQSYSFREGTNYQGDSTSAEQRDFNESNLITQHAITQALKGIETIGTPVCSEIGCRTGQERSCSGCRDGCVVNVVINPSGTRSIVCELTVYRPVVPGDVLDVYYNPSDLNVHGVEGAEVVDGTHTDEPHIHLSLVEHVKNEFSSLMASMSTAMLVIAMDSFVQYSKANQAIQTTVGVVGFVCIASAIRG